MRCKRSKNGVCESVCHGIIRGMRGKLRVPAIVRLWYAISMECMVELWERCIIHGEERYMVPNVIGLDFC